MEVVTGTGHWYKSGRPLVAVRWVFVRDLTGTHRDEYFFTTDSTMSPEAGDRDLHGSMEHRDHISRSTLLSPLGDDSRLEPEHGAASRPVPVRLVYGCGVLVRRVAVAVCASPRGGLARQARRDVLGRDHGGSSLAVAGMGFCDPRSSRSLLKTQRPIPANPAQWPGSSRLRRLVARSQRPETRLIARCDTNPRHRCCATAEEGLE